MTLLSTGFTSGIINWLFDIGGAIRIPLLTLSGLPLVEAFGINLFIIPVSSSVGAFTHRKNINFNYAKYMIIEGSIGSLTGALLVGFTKLFCLAILFLFVTITSVSGTNYKKMFGETIKLKNKPSLFLIFSTFLLNLIIGLRGGSGGTLFPPLPKTI